MLTLAVCLQIPQSSVLAALKGTYVSNLLTKSVCGMFFFFCVYFLWLIHFKIWVESKLDRWSVNSTLISHKFTW